MHWRDVFNYCQYVCRYQQGKVRCNCIKHWTYCNQFCKVKLDTQYQICTTLFSIECFCHKVFYAISLRSLNDCPQSEWISTICALELRLIFHRIPMRFQFSIMQSRLEFSSFLLKRSVIESDSIFVFASDSGKVVEKFWRIVKKRKFFLPPVSRKFLQVIDKFMAKLRTLSIFTFSIWKRRGMVWKSM